MAIEDNFQKLEENFKLIFNRIVPNGKAQIKLIKASEQEISQISQPSQVAAPS
jgi:chromosome segregation ATPase